MEYNIKNEFDAEWIYFKNDKDLEVCMCSRGASIYSLHIFGEPMILEFEKKEDFLVSSAYHGKTLGRVAGRIMSPINIDGKVYSLKLEKGFNYALHGGSENSISYKNFKSKVDIKRNKFIVSYAFKDSDENGFPGDCFIEIKYIFDINANVFKIEQRAKPTKKTYINLSNHLYFNFNSDQNISNYNLKMNTPYFGEVDDTIMIIEKKKIPAYFDFKNGANLGEKLDIIEKDYFVGTIDNTFLFNKTFSNKHNVTLENDKVRLDLVTNYPAMNIYVDNSMKPFVFKNNKGVHKRRGIALEPQLFDLDLKSILFEPSKKYCFYNKYSFYKKG